MITTILAVVALNGSLVPAAKPEFQAQTDYGQALKQAVTEKKPMAVLIGKGDACDIVLQDPCVSRVHCVLERHGPALFVRDSSSRNGTFLNDRRVECGELTPGTVLGIGLTQLVALGPSGRVRTGFDRLIVAVLDIFVHHAQAFAIC